MAVTRSSGAGTIPTSTIGTLASEISMRFRFRGLSHVISTGCTSSTDAIGYAFRNIQWGTLCPDAGGRVDAPIAPLILRGFMMMRILTPHWNRELSARGFASVFAHHHKSAQDQRRDRICLPQHSVGNSALDAGGRSGCADRAADPARIYDADAHSTPHWNRFRTRFASVFAGSKRIRAGRRRMVLRHGGVRTCQSHGAHIYGEIVGYASTCGFTTGCGSIT